MRYRRKPEVVEARQVTAENAAAVAKWCGGKVAADGTVEAATINGHVYTEFGDWLVRHGHGLECYDDAAFAVMFEPVRESPTDDNLRNLIYDTFGPERVSPGEMHGESADEGMDWLRSQLDLGNVSALPGILRDFFEIEADDADAEQLIEAWRKREAENK